MVDYTKEPCPKCGSMSNRGYHCMGCAGHGRPAMHMFCPKCKKEWVVGIPEKEKEEGER